MGVFGTVAAFLSTWLGGLVIVAIMAIAGLQYFRAESADDKRERLRAERRLKRKENKDDEVILILRSLSVRGVHV
jgi:hypothetical protein